MPKYQDDLTGLSARALHSLASARADALTKAIDGLLPVGLIGRSYLELRELAKEGPVDPAVSRYLDARRAYKEVEDEIDMRRSYHDHDGPVPAKVVQELRNKALAEYMAKCVALARG